MPKLRDLRAQLLWKVSGGSYWTDCPDLVQAQGVLFLCPLCFVANKGSVGTHSVICWFKGKVPDSLDPKPGRWNPSGTSLDDLTLVPPGMVSVLLTGGCGWHGFVGNGEAA